MPRASGQYPGAIGRGLTMGERERERERRVDIRNTKFFLKLVGTLTCVTVVKVDVQDRLGIFQSG